MTADSLPRRSALLAGGAVLASVSAVSGCGGGSGGGDGGTGGTGGTSSAGPLARTADIPVGGGTVFKDAQIVVTQPSAGVFKAFSAVCTHQGCLVDRVADGTIDCPCHGSKYRVADGTVAAGPAPRPLPEEPINVSAGAITLA
ncbi:Rieske (2Fe-2S) protein [Streptomyces sp. NPDC048659]|uniref:Rieske (2Fe-2S) protein n=1 Tax=Streptomyces sp. NPDC048659 TaxID=3155489 RepID=UPI003446934D